MSCRGPAIVIPHLMRNPGFFCSFLVPRFRGDDVWIPAGVYPREGGDGNDALGKLRRKRTHSFYVNFYVAHYTMRTLCSKRQWSVVRSPLFVVGCPLIVVRCTTTDH